MGGDGYPVLLRWGQGPELPKAVKNKLVTYFQSERLSNGGECEIRDTDFSKGSILIHFKDREVRDRVLQKKHHHVPVEGKTLTVYIDNPTHEGATEGRGGSGLSAGADHQEHNQPTRDIQKTKDQSQPDPSQEDGGPKSLESDLTKLAQWGRSGQIDSSSSSKTVDCMKYSCGSSSWTETTGKTYVGGVTRCKVSRSNSSGGYRSAGEPAEYQPTFYSEGRGGSGLSAGADLQADNHPTRDTQKRKDPSQPDPSREDGDPKSLEARHATLTEPGRSGIHGGSSVRMEENNHSPGTSSLAENEEKMSVDVATRRKELRRNSIGSHRSTGEPEIFSSVTARLLETFFPRTLQNNIKADLPSLVINNNADIVEVTGSYAEIQQLYQHLQWVQRPSAEIPSGTSSEESPADIQGDQALLPSALYEYITEIYKAELDELETRHRVKIHHATSKGSTSVSFVPQGSESSPEKARETFIDKVQRLLSDWHQESVDPSAVHLTFDEVKQRVSDHWRNILVIQEGGPDIILRGPREELSQALKFLQKTDGEPAGPGMALTSTSIDMRTEILVDERHMDILRKLKKREICDIEQKYDVKMEGRREKNGAVLITFKANAPPDLSPHALYSFITLLQKTFFNIEMKRIQVSPEFQEEGACMLEEELMMAGVDVVVECPNDESNKCVLLIGHPIHVEFAVEKLTSSHNPGRGQAAASSEEPMDTSSSSSDKQKPEEPDLCPICLGEPEDKIVLDKCKHAYCKTCLAALMARKPVCAICGTSYGTVRGNQPDGTMRETTNKYHLPGYPQCGTIEIYYDIPSGVQTENHPHPGKHFTGTTRVAYLPDNAEGRDILRLLKKAFDQRLTFTVGDSRTTSATDTVTWNDIHHKTMRSGGPQCFGYPDPDYLKRVRDELKAKGIE